MFSFGSDTMTFAGSPKGPHRDLLRGESDEVPSPIGDVPLNMDGTCCFGSSVMDDSCQRPASAALDQPIQLPMELSRAVSPPRSIEVTVRTGDTPRRYWLALQNPLLWLTRERGSRRESLPRLAEAAINLTGARIEAEQVPEPRRLLVSGLRGPGHTSLSLEFDNEKTLRDWVPELRAVAGMPAEVASDVRRPVAAPQNLALLSPMAGPPVSQTQASTRTPLGSYDEGSLMEALPSCASACKTPSGPTAPEARSIGVCVAHRLSIPMMPEAAHLLDLPGSEEVVRRPSSPVSTVFSSNDQEMQVAKIFLDTQQGVDSCLAGADEHRP